LIDKNQDGTIEITEWEQACNPYKRIKVSSGEEALALLKNWLKQNNLSCE
jgi:hypothetical protein